jgi:oligopeptide/dipeptide ABC transporter ATP-binding protein
MYASRIVETATVEELFDKPQHPYTEGLLKSVPKLHGNVERLTTIPGLVPNPARFPSGCKFHPRCQRTRQLAAQANASDVVQVRLGTETSNVLRRCQQEEPELREVMPNHGAACHQIANYDTSQLMKPRLEHKREVTPTVVEGVVP